MNELTPSHPAPPPAPQPPQTRGLAPPSYAFGAMNANVVNLAAMDRKSFQAVPRGAGVKYQSQQALQQVNEYHAGPYGSANFSHLKSPVDNRPVGSNNGAKFDYAPSQQYSQQQSYAAPYGYQSYAQNYGNTGDYQQQQQQQQQPQHQPQQQQQQQQQYHGNYNQVSDANPLGMLVSSATNPQADAMPHEHVNIGLKDAGDRKFRQPYNVDSFMSSSGGYVHGVERPGNVVQIKSTPSNSQQSMYQRSNMYNGGGGGALYYQRTQEQSTQQSPLNLVPPTAANFDANGSAGASSSMGRGINGMFSAGSRMPQFSPSALTTRLKDGGGDISTGASSSANGNHLPFMQQSVAKSLDATHPTTLYSDVASSTTSMAMVSLGSDGATTTSGNANALYPPSLAPPTSQLGANTEDSCSLCSGAHSDRVASHCGHRFHAQCLQSWGGLTACPICAQASNSITSVTQATPVNYGLGVDSVSVSGLSTGQNELGGAMNNGTTSTSGSNSVSISPSSVRSAQVSGINSLQMGNAVQGGRPPPIDTRIVDTRLGATTLSGEKRNSASTRSGSSSGGRVRKNKKLKDCSVPGCDRTVRSRGLCKGHGGGRRCGYVGCGLSDQGGGFCISHGGGKRCQHEGCDNSAQSRGLCKLHGGGSRCTVPNCTKSSQGRGLCRAHGGGRRCMVEGCNKTDRRAGYCVTHGADKKCIIPECSKTGRIDNMCTKHYFERHPAQPPGTVSTTPPPVITVNANTTAARARAERKQAAEQAAAAAAAANSYAATSSMMLIGSVPAPSMSYDGRVSGSITKTEPF
ncbi:hypothetical protein PR001_g1213 [Phytophthora rubi]|uniref:RING-type domain-containing protein n=2 Tax=Phytophthora rubi TaxID=129364 RepID=A0A6A3P195_9STRA|nr:hypothetical protein PR001_g1213 [Phytophthora rubi]